MRKGDTVEVTADRLDADGRGVGTCGEIRLHVSELLPGERGVAIVEHVSPHHPEAWARLDERVGEPAPERVAPACAAFGRCGGCTWQHLAYSAQLIAKRRIVRDALGDRTVDDVVPSPAQVHYRNLGKYVIGPGVLGSYAPRSHRLVSTLGCAVVEPIIDRVADALAARIGESDLEVYDEAARTGHLRYALIRSDGAHALVGIVTTSAAPAEAVLALAEALATAAPEVAGVVQVINDATTGALLGPEQRTLVGEPTIRERIGDLEVEVGVGAFFQINRVQAARMYAAVADWTGAGPGTKAVDLYCGVGGIALTLAARGADVVGIERHADSVATARAAAEHNGLTARFEVASADQIAQWVDTPDLIVVNPPRKGLDEETRAAVIALAPEQLVYVSCNPVTLARDLDVLSDAGYRATRITPFDLMPATAQVETVAILRR